MSMKRFFATLLLLLTIAAPTAAHAAIAVDAATTGGQTTTANTLSWSHTNSGTILIVGLTEENADDITGVTYNGVALTQYKKGTGGSGYGRPEIWGLVNPATGAHDVVISRTGTSGRLTGVASSYTGVAQSGQPDATGGNNGASVTTLTTSVTVVTADSWLVLAGDNSAENPSAGAGTTIRQVGSDASYLADSNAAVGTGSQSLIVNTVGSSNFGTAMISIAPAVAAAAVAQASQPLIAFGFE